MRVVFFRIILISFMILTIINEFVIYLLKPMVSWPDIMCNKSLNCVRILLVADPQILGEYNEYFFTRFDSDRYLRNTFSIALDYVKPDGIIFLGDLFDEGSIATDKQFNRYSERFSTIFQFKKLEKNDIKLIFIPGDNDIGGENNEIIKADHVMRFKKRFDQSDVQSIKHIRVTKVNKLLRTYPISDEKSNDKSIMNIAVSHIPLTSVINPFTEQVIQNVKPEFIFSAHDHKSYALLTLKEDGKLLYYEEMKYNAFKGGASTWTFQAARVTNYTIITEIAVPTCSYRMGSFDMGYGVIVHSDRSDEIVYHVLWLPSRLIFLGLYLIFITISAIFLWMNAKYIRRMYVKGLFYKI